MILHSSAFCHFHRLPFTQLPWRRRLCFSPKHPSYIRGYMFRWPIQIPQLQASAITFGNTNTAMDFSRNKKWSTNINSVSMDHSLTTHAFRRYWGWTEFGRKTRLDLMVETQDVYKLRFNIVTASVLLKRLIFRLDFGSCQQSCTS
jgi:hypothetical protein